MKRRPYYVLFDALERISLHLLYHEGGADGERAIAYSAFEMYLRDLEAINDEEHGSDPEMKQKLGELRRHAGRLAQLFPGSTTSDVIDEEEEHTAVSLLAQELRGSAFWKK
jgi:hypothetical protein